MNHSNDGGNPKQFIARLIRQGKVEYSVFDLIDACALNAPQIQAVRHSLTEIIEINGREQLKQSKQIYGTSQSILNRKEASVEPVFRTWVDCLRAAQPDYKMMRALCAQFASLPSAPSRQLEPNFLELIPPLVKSYKERTFQIVPAVADSLKKLHSDELSVAYLAFLQKYIPAVSEKSFMGLHSLSSVLFRSGDARLLASFEERCSPRVLQYAEHAERFLVNCGAAIHKVPNEIQGRYIGLCLSAASESFGSAAFIASDLPKKLTHMSTPVKDRYVDAFTRIVNKVGICTVGFCSGRLPEVLSTYPPDDVQKWVDIICTIASDFGRVAAYEYIIQTETPAERRSSAWRIYPHIREHVLVAVLVVLAVLATALIVLAAIVGIL